MVEYPFFEKVRSLLDKRNVGVEWLTSQLDKSERWLYNNKVITEISLSQIMTISKILDFDFLEDYNTWLIENNQNPISMVKEPEPYYITERPLTVEIKITAGYKTFGLHFGELLNILKKESEKFGFSVD